MKNSLRLYLAIAFCVTLCYAKTLFADASKIILLKDGSQLKGDIVTVNNDVYTIQTQNLGTVQIRGTDIVSITAENPGPTKASPALNLQGQAQNIQNQILSDPKLVSDLHNLTQDQEIMSILNDPNFLNDILSYDPERIQNNNKFQALINNPQFQQILNKIIEKVPAAVPAP